MRHPENRKMGPLIAEERGVGDNTLLYVAPFMFYQDVDGLLRLKQKSQEEILLE